jgi:crotonobetainyl-CoA:carnitine CoA-transferase CaiB-like acyl-CoA transferase
MTMLAPYRVLDLTDERGQIAGMILADLGADVIQVEPPGGSHARKRGPFLDAGPDVERSLSFAAYNRNKRSIEIDFYSDSGRNAFLALVRDSDFVLDSGPPSILDRAQLGFERLLAVNDQIVHVRTTPFGVDGPMAEAPAADLTIAALAGPVSVQGDPDRPPIRLSVPQAWRHAGAEAAVAALVGHARMRTTGAGVFADVSAQSALTWTMLNASLAGPIQGFDYQRRGANLQIGPKGGLPTVHPCKDGHIVTLSIGSLVRKIRPWLIESGAIDDVWLDQEQWDSYDRRLFRGGDVSISLSELTEAFDRFFVTRTKKELFRPGLAAGATIAPVQTIDDLLEFDQLTARDYFEELELPTGQTPKAPGPFARPSKTPLSLGQRAPRLGEHTQEVLDELDKNPRQRQAIVSEQKALPFEGLKVADFSWVGVGPISGKYLADHGANVIRIESSARADDLRTAGPYKDDEAGWNRSHFYGEFNTSKRSLALDLKHDRSSEVKARILDWADVILESFTPGAVGRLGIDYESAREANPSVIMVSTCLMGQTGPLASMAGYGYHAAGIAGFYELTGYPDRPPVGPWNAYTDTVAPRFLTATLLAALDHRRRTGEGQHIDLGQMEAALHFLAPEILARQATGRVYDRAANRDPDHAPQGVYPCVGEDEWVAIAIETDAQWQALRKALGEPEWACDSRFDTTPGRLENHDSIDAGLSLWTREHNPREAMQTLLDAGVPAGHVQRSSDLVRDPQLAHRGFYRVFEHGEMGRIPYSGHQFRISGHDNGPRGPAPLLGGESFEILCDELGFDPETIADLMAAGAIS